MSQEQGPDHRKDERAALSLGAIVEGASRVLGVLGAATLALSAFYDFSYLKALGLGFSEVQTTLSDHARSALVWIPALLVGVAFYALWELTTRRIEGFRSEEELAQGTRNPERTRRFRQGPHKAMTILICIIIVTQFLFVRSDSSWYVIFGLGWGLAASGAVRHERVRPLLTTGSALAIVLIPFAAASIGYQGYLSAERALTSPTPRWRITLATELGKPAETVDATLIRRFSSTAVLVTTQGEVWVVPEGSVQIATRVQGPPSRSLVCMVTGYLCNEASVPAKKVDNLQPAQAPTR